jgi:hypothetical protein
LTEHGFVYFDKSLAVRFLACLDDKLDGSIRKHYCASSSVPMPQVIRRAENGEDSTGFGHSDAVSFLLMRPEEHVTIMSVEECVDGLCGETDHSLSSVAPTKAPLVDHYFAILEGWISPKEIEGGIPVALMKEVR